MLLDYPNFDEAILEYSALTDSTSVIYKDYPLFKLASNELYSTLLFDDDLYGLNHFVYLDDYLVFASNEEDIKALINQNLAGRTLNNNTGFLGMTDHLLLSDQFVMHNADYTGKNQLIYPFDISAGGGIRYHQIIDEGDRQLIHYAERMKSTTPGTPYSESPTQEFPLDYSLY